MRIVRRRTDDRPSVLCATNAFIGVVVAVLSLGPGAVLAQDLDALVADLSSPDAARREKATLALGAAGATAAPRLARIAQSGETDAARLAALEALLRNSMAYAYSYVIWGALPDADEDASARRVVWDCLIRLGDSFLAVGEFGAASDHYCDLLESAVNPAERSKAIRGLGRSSRRRAAEEVFAALADDDALVRAAALAAVAELRWGQARPHLERALKTAEPPLLAGLLDALSRRREPAAAAMVTPFLDHEDPSVRSAARRARARHAGFVTEWWVLGPLPAGESSSKNPELTVASFRPREDRTVRVGAKSLEWQRLVASGSNGVIDLAPALELPGPGVAYACAEVVAESAKRVRLSLTGEIARAWWLDGRRIGVTRAEKSALEVELRPGTHRIVIELARSPRACVFCLRVTDESNAPVVLAPPASAGA